MIVDAEWMLGGERKNGEKEKEDNVHLIQAFASNLWVLSHKQAVDINLGVQWQHKKNFGNSQRNIQTNKKIEEMRQKKGEHKILENKIKDTFGHKDRLESDDDDDDP